MELLEKLAKCFALCSMKVAYQRMTQEQKEETIIYVGGRIAELGYLTEDKKLQDLWVEFGNWIVVQENK